MSALSFLPVLDRKLLRDLWRLRGPALAIALVLAAGVGMVLMSFGMMRSLEDTRDAYYDRYRFADVFAHAKRVPQAVLRDIARLPGVRTAESRITMPALIDLAGVAEPANALLHSLPASGRPRVNDLVLRSGRWPDPRRANEVLANEAFVVAARLEIGNSIDAILGGKRQRLTVVGTVLSPEYVYAIPPGQIFPDNARFAILWMHRETLAGAFDLTNAFNAVGIRLERGAEPRDVVRRLDTLLAPYGGTGAYLRAEQLSNRFVTNELDQLRSMTGILPPIFLGVAAFLTHIVFGRLIDTEREIIGLMKAFGYRTGAVVRHYLKLAVLLSAGGMALGVLLGAWLGRGLAEMYQAFFVFPFLQFRIDADLFAAALLAALLAVLSGSLVAIRRVARLTPGDAMRPPLPVNYAGGAARLFTRFRWLDELTRIVLRGLARRPVRTALTSLGIAAALALYIASAGSTDNVDALVRITFDQSEREDVLVTFIEPRGPGTLDDLARVSGVLRAEPVHAATALLTFGQRSKREALTAIAPRPDLSRLIDVAGNVIDPPENGLIISAALARSLQAGVGDSVDVAITEGRRPKWRAPIVAIVESPIGSPAYVGLAYLDRHMMDGPRISGAFLAIDSNDHGRIMKALKAMPVISGVSLVETSRRGIRETIAETMGIITLFNSGFAMLIVFGVVYNNARISLAERGRDLASLRVMGFRHGEISYTLVGELALLTLLAIPPGIYLGFALSRYIVEAFGSDLFTVPFALSWGTIGKAVLVVFAAAAATAALIHHRIGRLDLVAVLKTRE